MVLDRLGEQAARRTAIRTLISLRPLSGLVSQLPAGTASPPSNSCRTGSRQLFSLADGFQETAKHHEERKLIG